MLIFEENYFLK